jgi:Arc/MetJ family transcription regulator
MSRTNIELDDEKVDRVMRAYGLRSKREAVDLALDRLLGQYEQADVLDLQGTGWDGDLDAMRESRFP